VRRLSWLNLTTSWREPRALRGCVKHGAALRRQRQSIGHLAASGREKRCERRRGTVEASADGGTPFAFELKDSGPLQTGEDRRSSANLRSLEPPRAPANHSPNSTRGSSSSADPGALPEGYDLVTNAVPDAIAPRWLDRTSIMQRRQSLTNHPVAIHSI
jgi:hypothetical protein